MQDRELRICEGVSIIHAKQAVKFGRVRHGQDQVGLSGCLDPILLPRLDEEINLLELGMYQGRSLDLWRDYFPQGTLVGMDLKLPANFAPGDRIQLFEGARRMRAFYPRSLTGSLRMGLTLS